MPLYNQKREVGIRPYDILNGEGYVCGLEFYLYNTFIAQYIIFDIAKKSLYTC